MKKPVTLFSSCSRSVAIFLPELLCSLRAPETKEEANMLMLCSLLVAKKEDILIKRWRDRCESYFINFPHQKMSLVEILFSRWFIGLPSFQKNLDEWVSLNS